MAPEPQKSSISMVPLKELKAKSTVHALKGIKEVLRKLSNVRLKEKLVVFFT